MNPYRQKDEGSENTYDAISAGVVILVFLASLLNAATGCNRYPEPVMPLVAETQCSMAFEHIQSIGCDYLLVVPGPDELENTADDIPWKAFCERVQRGSVLPLGLNCAMDQYSCAEIELCL